MARYFEMPCAAKGLFSYRYKGPKGWIMIGAKNHQDALHQARASIGSGSSADVSLLQIWEGEKYVPVSSTNPPALSE